MYLASSIFNTSKGLPNINMLKNTKLEEEDPTDVGIKKFY